MSSSHLSVVNFYFSLQKRRGHEKTPVRRRRLFEQVADGNDTKHFLSLCSCSLFVSHQLLLALPETDSACSFKVPQSAVVLNLWPAGGVLSCSLRLLSCDPPRIIMYPEAELSVWYHVPALYRKQLKVYNIGMLHMKVWSTF